MLGHRTEPAVQAFVIALNGGPINKDVGVIDEVNRNPSEDGGHDLLEATVDGA